METENSLKNYIENEELNIEKIINDYSKYLYTVIKNYSKYNLREEDIEEIIAETFFVLWKNYKKMSEKDKITSYLATVAKNITYTHLRKIRKSSNMLDISDYENTLQGKDNIENLYEEHEKIEKIQIILEDMDMESRQIFMLFYYEQRKAKEISAILGISEAKVKTRLHRIRKKIKKELLKGGYSYE